MHVCKNLGRRILHLRHTHTCSEMYNINMFNRVRLTLSLSSLNRSSPPAPLASFRSHNPPLLRPLTTPTHRHLPLLLTPLCQGSRVVQGVRAAGYLLQTHQNRQRQRKKKGSLRLSYPFTIVVPFLANQLNAKLAWHKDSSVSSNIILMSPGIQLHSLSRQPFLFLCF